jgi:hypothetical protein
MNAFVCIGKGFILINYGGEGMFDDLKNDFTMKDPYADAAIWYILSKLVF